MRFVDDGESANVVDFLPGADDVVADAERLSFVGCHAREPARQSRERVPAQSCRSDTAVVRSVTDAEEVQTYASSQAAE